MANQKIVLAELDLDAKALLKAAADAKDAIIKLTKEIEACKQAGADFSKLQAQLEKIIGVYQTQQQAVINVTGVTEELIAQQNELNDALQTTLNLSRQVNGAIQSQDKTFDDYKEQINDALNSINIFNGGWNALKQRAQESGSWGGLFTSALGGVTQGLKGMGQAIMTNPLGLLLQLVAPIIEQLKNFAPLTNAVEQAMAALSPVIDLATMPIKLLGEGLTWVVGGFTKLIGAMSDSASEATKLKKAEQDLATQMALQEGANAKAKQQADELLQKSQDYTLSERDRAKAIHQATQIQLKNYEERKQMANKAFANEVEKFAQSQDLSQQEIEILKEGDTAKVRSLLKSKEVGVEELEALEKAREEKATIAEDEVKIKEDQADAIKTVVDGLIEKSKDQSLTDKQRVDALKEAGKIETAYYYQRRQIAENDYKEAMSNMFASKGVRLEDVKGILAQGDAYKNKARLLKLVTQDEIDTLLKAQDKKNKMAREGAALTKSQADAMDGLDKQLGSEKESREKKALQESQQRKKLELDIFMQQHKDKLRTYDEEVAYIKEVERRKKAIVEEAYRASDKSENDRLAKKLALGDIELEAAKSKTDAKAARDKKAIEENMAAAKAAHDEVIEANNEILTKNKTLNDTLVSQEKARLDAVAVADKAYAQQKFDNKVISETELNAEITRIDTESAEAKKTLDQELSDTEAAKKVEELEAKKVEKETAFLDNLAIEQEQDDIKRAQQLANVDLTAAQREEINKKYDDAATAREKSKNDYIANSRAQLFESIKGLFNKESKIGKAIAVAEITNSTAKSAMVAFGKAAEYASDPFTIPLAINAAIQGGIIVATGAAQIKKTVGAKFEDGGLVTVGGNRHSNGGTLFTGADGTRFEAEQGELIGVMNRNAAAHFMAFNNAFPAGGSSAPNYFANGGIVSREMAQPGLNIDELAAKISLANAAIPAPVVAVQDIITQGNSYVSVRDAANF